MLTTTLGKHWYVKPVYDCPVHFLRTVRVSWITPNDWLDFTFPQTSSKGTWTVVRLQSHIPVPFTGSSGCSCLLPWDAEILHHALHFDVALAQGGWSPPATHRVETMQWNAKSGQGQDRFHRSCAAAAASSSLFPSCSNYRSSAQINNCASKPSEQMNSGPRANLRQWSFATAFKWDWDLALQPSPVFPLFTHPCVAHV